MENFERKKFVKFFTWNHSKMEYAVLHKHEHFELVYYLGGKGMTTLGGEEFSFHDGAVAVIAPGVAHDDTSTTPTCVYCLAFNYFPNFFQSVLIERTDNNKDINLQILERLRILDGYCKEGGHSDDEFEEQVDIIVLLLMKLTSLNYQKRVIYYDQIVNYVKNYLNTNCGYKINFEILSDLIGYSCDRLRKLFKAHTGKSVYQYLIDLRLAKAKELLMYTEKDIGAIAGKCGFSGIVRFSLFFKEKMSVSPSEFRLLSRKKKIHTFIVD
jgi:AraC-like DNA-binding protein